MPCVARMRDRLLPLFPEALMTLTTEWQQERPAPWRADWMIL